ncbi:MAG: T9SS type A sorting domain-containing protein, partial [Flavobacterium sp.]
ACTATYCDSIHIGNIPNCIANFNYQHLPSPYTYVFNNLSAASATGFFWHFGDGTVSNAVSPVHQFATAGPRQVCLTLIDTIHHCSNTKCVVVNAFSSIVQNSFSVERTAADPGDEAEELKVNVYPNPATDFIRVHIENAKSPVTFLMYDNTGKVIINKNEMANGEFDFNNTTFSSGIYFYRILSNENEAITGKLIIQK